MLVEKGHHLSPLDVAHPGCGLGGQLAVHVQVFLDVHVVNVIAVVAQDGKVGVTVVQDVGWVELDPDIRDVFPHSLVGLDAVKERVAVHGIESYL